MNDAYTIRALTEEFGVTARTLRHYEELGLLAPTRSGLARVYSGRDRARLRVALRAKRLGFTLQEIRELFELYDGGSSAPERLADFLQRLDRRRAMLEQQREDLEVVLSEIHFFADHCRRVLAGESGARLKRKDLPLT